MTLSAARRWAGLAALAALEEQPEHAARLLGAATALGGLADVGIEVSVERAFIAPARARCDQVVWARAERSGAAMTLDEAVRYAVGALPAPAHAG